MPSYAEILFEALDIAFGGVLCSKQRAIRDDDDATYHV